VADAGYSDWFERNEVEIGDGGVMEFYQIKYYCALCDTLHFGRAAERCGVSQPALTRAIQRLEQELGGPLIRRKCGSTHLTDLGRLVRPMLEEVLANSESVKTAAHRLLEREEKSLRFGISPSVGTVCLAPFLASFSARYPETELTLVEDEESRLEELLLAGNLDLAMAASCGPANKRLHNHQLYLERAVVVFRVGHRFESQESVRLVDLKGENFLMRSRCSKLPFLDKSCQQHGFKLNVVHRSERDDWIQMMVAAGHGVTLMPGHLHLGNGTSARPLIEPTVNCEISLITVAGRPHTPPLKHFLRAAFAHQWGSPLRRAADVTAAQVECESKSADTGAWNSRVGVPDTAPHPDFSQF
jgi:DNA-binding transcriptional LysR family regulator